MKSRKGLDLLEAGRVKSVIAVCRMRGRGQVRTHKSVVKYPKELNAPQVRKTTIQVVVNADCCQTELGMIAGLFNCSCLRIHTGNDSMRTRATESRAIF